MRVTMRSFSGRTGRLLVPSVTSGPARRWSSVVDDALRVEVRRTVRDPNNRAAVYALLEKASAASWDLSSVLKDVSDPFKSVEPEMKKLNRGIMELVANKHPLLSLMAQYYFQVPGKRFRPTVVLLVGQACGAEGARPSERHIQLAEIVEMIHTASLAHDDVLDGAATRRGEPSMPAAFGNKFAVLVGDFLLARASVSLAGLRDHRVTELLSQMIAELVEGEFVQMRPQGELSLDLYRRKCYLKTASMLRAAARAAALLSEASEEQVEAASCFGEALGMAFQVVDDVLDLRPNTGKAQHQDLISGLATAPLLLAARQQPALDPLIRRGFSEPGDAARALELLAASSGVEEAMAMAAEYAGAAKAALQLLPPSHSRHVLGALTDRVLTRSS